MSSWIKIHRKMLQWEWYQDGNTARVFLHCLLNANWEPKSWRGTSLEIGSFPSSAEKVGVELGLSRQIVRTAFDKLVMTHELEIQSTNEGSIIKIVNWKDYQCDEEKNNQLITNEITTSATSQLTTIKEEKNVRKESIPFSEIVNYLNEKTGKSYRHNIATTQKRISARFSEGFRLEDFKKVIDNKVKDWKDDPKMSEYLRPETLFGTKFESYLNAKTEPTNKIEQVWTEEKRKRAKEIMEQK